MSDQAQECESLTEARAVRNAVAAGDPPEGWPTATSGEWEGQPVPKCSLILCAEPGIFKVSVVALTSYTGYNVFACSSHLEHFADGAVEWMGR